MVMGWVVKSLWISFAVEMENLYLFDQLLLQGVELRTRKINHRLLNRSV